MVTSSRLLLATILAAIAFAEPWQPMPPPSPGLWFEARLAEATPADARLVFRGYTGELDLFVDDRPIYAFRDQAADGRLTVHVVELPRGTRLRVRVRETARPPYFSGSRIVTKAEVPFAIVAVAAEPLRDDLDDLIARPLIASVGFIAMILAAIRRRGDARVLFYFGAFAFLYGLRLIVQSALFPLAGAPIETMRRIEWIITYVITVPGWALPRRLVGDGWKGSLRWQVWAFALFAPIAIASDVLQDRASTMEEANNILVVIGGINILLNLILVRRRRDTRPVLIGSIVFMLFALANNLASLGLLPVDEIDETPGFMAFLGTLGYAAARRFAQTEREQIELQGELSAAREIQRSILPAVMPDVAGLRFDARYVPATTVAGDLYDFLPIDERRAGVIVADVSGHGIPAALIASMVKIAVSSQSRLADQPAALLRELNAALTKDVRRGFVTATYLFFDGDRVHVANAGHPAPLLLRAGEVRELGAVNPLLGRFKTAAYAAETVPLRPGDRILAYTDGVTEARNARGEEFGEERLRALVREGASAERIVEAVQAWGRDLDDLTLVMIEVGTTNGTNDGR